MKVELTINVKTFLVNTILFIVLLFLKVTKIINMSWIIVFAPLWVTNILTVLVLVVGFIIMMKSYLAGLVIGIGCIANMAVGRGVLGAFLFSIGLLLILTNEYKLYTGVVPYVSFDFDSITYVIFVWCWNVLGGMTAAVITMFARPDLVEVAKTISAAKMKESWRIVLLSILCNFMIYFAVESYRRIKHQVGKYLMVILCVMIFVLCGFEHSIANVTYLLMGCDAVGVLGYWQILFSCTIGNAVGGILIHNLDKNAEGA